MGAVRLVPAASCELCTAWSQTPSGRRSRSRRSGHTDRRCPCSHRRREFESHITTEPYSRGNLTGVGHGFWSGGCFPQARLLALFEGRRRDDTLLTLLVNSDLAHEALLVTSGFLNERCAAYRVDPRNFSRCVPITATGLNWWRRVCPSSLWAAVCCAPATGCARGHPCIQLVGTRLRSFYAGG